MWRLVPLALAPLVIIAAMIVAAIHGSCSPADYAAKVQRIYNAGKVRSVAASNKGIVVCTNGSAYGIER